jgi:hypothetical protein
MTGLLVKYDSPGWPRMTETAAMNPGKDAWAMK